MHSMKIEQSESISIIEAKKNEFQNLDIVVLSKRAFESIDSLFRLLSLDTIEQQSFSIQSAQDIFNQAMNVVCAEQRLHFFIPYVHHKLTLLDALHNQTDILHFVEQVQTIAQILDIVAEEMQMPSQLYSEASRVIRHDVYVPKEFDSSDSTGTVALFELLVRLQAITLLSV